MVAYGFAKLRVKHPDLSASLVQELCKRARLMEWRALGQLAWALEVFGALDRDLAETCMQSLHDQLKVDAEPDAELLVQAVTALSPHINSLDSRWKVVLRTLTVVQQNVTKTLLECGYKDPLPLKQALLSHGLAHIGPVMTQAILTDIGVHPLREDEVAHCIQLLDSEFCGERWRTATARNLRVVLLLGTRGKGGSYTSQVISGLHNERCWGEQRNNSPFWTLPIGHDRGAHAEVVALTRAIEMEEKENEFIGIYGERFPCLSCLAVMAQYKAMTPSSSLMVSFATGLGDCGNLA